MNLKDRLLTLARLISDQDRASGRTTLIAKAAKDLNGLVICHNHDSARFVSHQHGVPAKSMDINLEAHGYSGPFFMDHHAVATMFKRSAQQLEFLEVSDRQKVLELSRKNLQISFLEAKVRELETENKRLAIDGSEETPIDAR